MRSTHFQPCLRAMRQLSAAAVIAFAAMTAPSTSAMMQSTPPAEAFDATGLQAKKGYFSQLPFETVDMVNGAVMLMFTDLALPGNAGMQVTLARTYNRGNYTASRRWDFGLAGIPVQVINPTGAEGLPVLSGADGSSHRAYPSGGIPTDIYVTEEFWQYNRATRTLKMPNGWVLTYDNGTGMGGATLTEVRDQFDNTLTPTFEAWPGPLTEFHRP